MLPPPADTVSTSTRGSAIGTPAISPPLSVSRLAVEHEPGVRARAANVDRERVRISRESRDVCGARHAARGPRQRERRRGAPRHPLAPRIPPLDVITESAGIALRLETLA